jgi:hypothetical protein
MSRDLDFSNFVSFRSKYHGDIEGSVNEIFQVPNSPKEGGATPFR